VLLERRKLSSQGLEVSSIAIALSPAERAALDAALPPGSMAGPRYAVERVRTVDR
jgi:hypothetical protein